MNEKLLSYIWRFRQFNQICLKTSCQKTLQIYNPGILNNNAGPDFSHCHIRVDGVDWHGHVEIHCKSSDWNLHKHQNDSAYNSVVLHVVWENDQIIYNQSGGDVLTLELKAYVDKSLLNNFRHLMDNELWIPCQNSIASVNSFHLHQFLERLLIERLERKSKEIEDALFESNNDCEEVFYQQFSKYLSSNINSESMYTLSKKIPLKIVQKHKNEVFQIEALLFGVSGLLFVEEDEYALKLQD